MGMGEGNKVGEPSVVSICNYHITLFFGMLLEIP